MMVWIGMTQYVLATSVFQPDRKYTCTPHPDSRSRSRAKRESNHAGYVAVMEMEDDAPYPKMISKRAKGCVRVVKLWPKRFLGISEKCAANVAKYAAEELIRQLNANKLY